MRPAGRAPLFLRDISVGDVLSVTFDCEGRVADFHHASRAKNTTVWLLRLDREEATLGPVLSELRSLGCDTVTLESQGCYAVSVPETTSLESIDAVLARLDQDAVAIAFPSIRHEDEL